MTISPVGAAGLLVAAVIVTVILTLARRTRTDPLLPDGADKTPSQRALSTALTAILIAGVVMLVLVAFVPVRASATRTGQVVVETGSAPITSSASIPSAEMDIRLTATGEVTMTVPVAISMAAAQNLPGVTIDGWSPVPERVGAYVSDRSDNSFSIVGRFTTLDLRFAASTEASSVTIDTGVAQQSVTLVPGAPEQSVSIRSGSTREVARAAFMWSGSELRFTQPMSATEWTTIGLLPVRSVPVLDDAGNVVGVRVGVVDATSALAGSAVDVLLLVAVALLLLAVGFVVAAACGPAIDRTGGLSRFRFAAYGLALAMLAVGTANYVLPARYAVWLLAPALVFGVIRLIRHSGANGIRPVPAERPVGDLTGSIVAIVVVTAIQFFWFVLSGRWSLGFLQTDVFDTFNVTGLLWDRSALDASIAFGDGFRLLDYTARASVWGTMLERPSDAIVVFRLLLSVVVAALAASLVARQGYRQWVQVTVGVLVAGSSAFVGLYAEGYMSREFFVSWMLIGLLMVGHQFLDDDRRSSAWWKVGIVASVSLAIVPPYFLLGPALLLAMVLSSSGAHWRSTLSTWRPAATGVTLSIVVLGLPNLFWLRSSSDASQYINSLNSLVRNIGVPFYDSLRFPAAMLGLVPFHHQDGYRLGGTTIHAGPLRWDTDWLTNSIIVVGFILLAAGLFLLSVWMVIRMSRSVVDRGFATLWIAVVMLYFAGLFVLRFTRWDEQTYFAIMWIWTLAPIALTGIIFTYLEAGRLQPKLKTTILIGVVSFGLVNVVSAAGESVLWVESPYSELASDWHYDLAAPLDRFDRELRRGGVDLKSVDFAVVIDRPSSLTGTDDDRVLTNVLVNLLEADGRRCPDCQRNPDFYWVTASATAPSDIPIVLIGTTDCALRPELYSDEFFAVCGATRS
jgi:hypothetical protein